jgi:hypothetical protein
MTGMSKSDGPGVAANRARKRRLWLVFLSFVAIGAAVDAVLIPIARHAPHGGPYLPSTIAIVAATVLVLMGTAGVWLWLRSVDELDRQHNLIACTIGFLFNISAYAAWYLLSLAAIVGRPDPFVLFVSSGAVAALAYCWMKVKAPFG